MSTNDTNSKPPVGLLAPLIIPPASFREHNDGLPKPLHPAPVDDLPYALPLITEEDLAQARALLPEFPFPQQPNLPQNLHGGNNFPQDDINLSNQILRDISLEDALREIAHQVQVVACSGADLHPEPYNYQDQHDANNQVELCSPRNFEDGPELVRRTSFVSVDGDDDPLRLSQSLISPTLAPMGITLTSNKHHFHNNHHRLFNQPRHSFQSRHVHQGESKHRHDLHGLLSPRINISAIRERISPTASAGPNSSNSPSSSSSQSSSEGLNLKIHPTNVNERQSGAGVKIVSRCPRLQRRASVSLIPPDPTARSVASSVEKMQPAPAQPTNAQPGHVQSQRLDLDVLPLTVIPNLLDGTTNPSHNPTDARLTITCPLPTMVTDDPTAPELNGTVIQPVMTTTITQSDLDRINSSLLPRLNPNPVPVQNRWSAALQRAKAEGKDLNSILNPPTPTSPDGLSDVPIYGKRHKMFASLDDISKFVMSKSPDEALPSETLLPPKPKVTTFPSVDKAMAPELKSFMTPCNKALVLCVVDMLSLVIGVYGARVSATSRLVEDLIEVLVPLMPRIEELVATIADEDSGVWTKSVAIYCILQLIVTQGMWDVVMSAYVGSLTVVDAVLASIQTTAIIIGAIGSGGVGFVARLALTFTNASFLVLHSIDAVEICRAQHCRENQACSPVFKQTPVPKEPVQEATPQPSVYCEECKDFH